MAEPHPSFESHVEACPDASAELCGTVARVSHSHTCSDNSSVPDSLSLSVPPSLLSSSSVTITVAQGHGAGTGRVGENESLASVGQHSVGVRSVGVGNDERVDDLIGMSDVAAPAMDLNQLLTNIDNTPATSASASMPLPETEHC